MADVLGRAGQGVFQFCAEMFVRGSDKTTREQGAPDDGGRRESLLSASISKYRESWRAPQLCSGPAAERRSTPSRGDKRFTWRPPPGSRVRAHAGAAISPALSRLRAYNCRLPARGNQRVSSRNESDAAGEPRALPRGTTLLRGFIAALIPAAGNGPKRKQVRLNVARYLGERSFRRNNCRFKHSGTTGQRTLRIFFRPVGEFSFAPRELPGDRAIAFVH